MFKHSLWKKLCHVVGQEWEAGALLSISYCALYNPGSGHTRSLSKTTIVLMCRYWWHFLMAHRDQSNVLMFPARAKRCPPFTGSWVRSQKLPLLFQSFWWHWEENWAHGLVFGPSQGFTWTSSACPYGKYWIIQLIKAVIFRNKRWNKNRFWPVIIFLYLF